MQHLSCQVPPLTFPRQHGQHTRGSERAYPPRTRGRPQNSCRADVMNPHTFTWLEAPVLLQFPLPALPSPPRQGLVLAALPAMLFSMGLPAARGCQLLGAACHPAVSLLPALPCSATWLPPTPPWSLQPQSRRFKMNTELFENY